MEQSNWSKLKAAIAAVLIARKDLSDREVAMAVSKAEADVFFVFALDRVSAVVQMQRRIEELSVDPRQMAFPFHERDLAILIPTKKGPIEIRTATIGKLREAESLLLKKREDAALKPRRNSLLGRIQLQISILHPYSYANRKLTVGKFIEAEVNGIALPKQTRTSGMSDAMRRYWDTKSPEERSAIIRRRQAKAKAKREAKKAGKKGK